jgi:hypothetical protein
MSGQTLKDAGMKLAADNRRKLLERARQIAMTAAHQNGTVTADDVAAHLKEPLGPAAGSIFRTGDFVFTGTRIRSAQENNHARELKVWRLSEEGQKNAQKQFEKVQQHCPGARQAEERLHRQPVRTPIETKTPAPALPSWLK